MPYNVYREIGQFLSFAYFLVRWHAGDVIFAWLACALKDINICLHLEWLTYLSINNGPAFDLYKTFVLDKHSSLFGKEGKKFLTFNPGLLSQNSFGTPNAGKNTYLYQGSLTEWGRLSTVDLLLLTSLNQLLFVLNILFAINTKQAT